LRPAEPAAKAPPPLSRAADVSGFVINGTRAAPIGGAANSVAGAGDINGDGLADLIIGSPKEDIGLPNDAGRSYAVFGRTGNTAVDLSTVAWASAVLSSLKPLRSAWHRFQTV
jgi:hypothetical protein